MALAMASVAVPATASAETKPRGVLGTAHAFGRPSGDAYNTIGMALTHFKGETATYGFSAWCLDPDLPRPFGGTQAKLKDVELENRSNWNVGTSLAGERVSTPEQQQAISALLSDVTGSDFERSVEAVVQKVTGEEVDEDEAALAVSAAFQFLTNNHSSGVLEQEHTPDALASGKRSQTTI